MKPSGTGSLPSFLFAVFAAARILFPLPLRAEKPDVRARITAPASLAPGSKGTLTAQTRQAKGVSASGGGLLRPASSPSGSRWPP